MSESSSDRYRLRGVSAQKEDVHNAIKNINKGVSIVNIQLWPYIL